jgi:hypothetical protein
MNFSIIRNIASKIKDVNISEGVKVFNKSVQEFGDSMDKLTQELNTTGTNKVKIWSEKNDNSQKISNDMEKIWGTKK